MVKSEDATPASSSTTPNKRLSSDSSNPDKKVNPPKNSPSLLRMPEWSWNTHSNSNTNQNPNLSSSPTSADVGKDGKRRGSGGSPQAAPALSLPPHSRFIPEAERGWKRPGGEFVSVASNSEDSTETAGGEAQLLGGDNQLGTGLEQDLKKDKNPTSKENRRKSLPASILSVFLEKEKEHKVGAAAGSKPSNNSKTSTLSPNQDQHSSSMTGESLSRTSSPVPVEPHSTFGDAPRGYAHDKSMPYPSVNPFHRNPTAKQAFYDTHFGDSSLALATKKMKKKVTGFGMLKSLGVLGATGKERKLESVGSQGVGTSEEKRDQIIIQESVLQEEEEEEEEPENDEDTLSHLQPISPPSTLPRNISARMLRQTASVNSELDEATSPDELDLVASIEEDGAAGSTPYSRVAPSTHATSSQHQSTLWSTISARIGTIRTSISHGLPSLDGLVSAPSTKSSKPQSSRNLDQEEPSRPSKGAGIGFLPIGLGRNDSTPKGSDRLPPTVRSAAHAWSGIAEKDWTIPEVSPTIHRDVKTSEVFKHLSGNVVILGGYRGSVLRDSKTKEMMWIPIKVGVKLRNPKLELGLDQASEDNSEDLVYSSGGVTNIGKLVDMGKRLHEKCSSRKGVVTYDFGYDWRLSLRGQSPKLVSFLEDLKTATGVGAHVIAHSMGGLLTLHALSQAKDPSIFRSIVFASSPFQGTANMCGPLAWGDAALKNDLICSPRATFSFRSSFYLLPRDGRCFELEVKRSKNMDEEKEIGTLHKDSDFFDVETWKDWSLSPCLSREWKAIEDGKKITCIVKSSSKGSADQVDPSSSSNNTETQNGFPGLSMATSPEGEIKSGSPEVETTTSNDADSPKGPTEQIADKAAEAVVKVGAVTAEAADPSSSPALAQELEDGKLMPENRADLNNSVPSSNSQASVKSPGGDETKTEEDIKKDKDQREAWGYLKRTLQDVKAFDEDIVKAFDESRFKDYPPISILTSGRTPTVRGALVSKNGWDAEEEEEVSSFEGTDEADEGWKKDIRDANYSRMLYAPGDGVILRRSSVALPGSWSRLLVKDSELVQLEAEKEKIIHHSDPTSSQSAKSTGAESKPQSLTQRLKLEISDGVVETSHRHVTLLSDLTGVGICLEANRRAEVVRKGKGNKEG